ncbi:MAG TPA: hypothetical protein VJ227_00750 [Patescibacteria group bacterium]|nr:hypothetical protein [Patescibacteria group bacterium]
MDKERRPQASETSTSPELVRRLLESFGKNNWEFTQHYINYGGYFMMELKSKSGKKRIEYEDYYQRRTEITLWDGYRGILVFEQQVTTKPRDIINLITVPVFSSRGEPMGVVSYGPDGEMRPERQVKGFPKKIDTEATAVAFLEQVIAGKFGRPKLIKPQRR